MVMSTRVDLADACDGSVVCGRLQFYQRWMYKCVLAGCWLWGDLGWLRVRGVEGVVKLGLRVKDILNGWGVVGGCGQRFEYEGFVSCLCARDSEDVLD